MLMKQPTVRASRWSAGSPIAVKARAPLLPESMAWCSLFIALEGMALCKQAWQGVLYVDVIVASEGWLLPSSPMH